MLTYPGCDSRRIFLLCPTYNRPENVERFIRVINETANEPGRITVVFGYDHADPGPRINPIPRSAESLEIIVHEQNTRGSGLILRTISIIYPEAFDDIVVGCGDDSVFETQSWDKVIYDITANRATPWLYWGNDGIQFHHLAAFPFMTNFTIHTLNGYMYHFTNFSDVFQWLIFHIFDPPRVTYVPELLMTHRANNVPGYLVRKGNDFGLINSIGSDIATRQVLAIKAAMIEAGEIPVIRDVVEYAGLTFRWDGKRIIARI